MAPRRPPDILRKSHAHSEGDTRSRSKRELERELHDTIDDAAPKAALLIDLDGVVYQGDAAISGAADTIGWLVEHRVRHLFLTNTTSRPRSALVDKLADFGIDVGIDDILAPPDAAAAWLDNAGCRRLKLLVPDATAEAFCDFDIVAADKAQVDPVDAVVVGDLGAGWSYERLNQAFRCLMQAPPPKLVALGMTRYWSAADGLRLDTAPFVVALAHASGVEPSVLGKPAREFFEIGLQRLGVPASDAWIIGDDIAADVGGAQAAGIKGILVKTGKFRPQDLGGAIEPDLVIESIADLLRAWPAEVSS